MAFCEKINLSGWRIDEIFIGKEEGLMWINLSDINGNKKQISCDISRNSNWSGTLNLSENILSDWFNRPLNLLGLELNDILITSELKLTNLE
jgi:hypothetical protein